MKQSKFQGIGMIVKQNGNILLGRFSNGFVEGQSFFLFYDGSYYKGKMKDNLANDEFGFYQCQNFTYTGGFRDNMFHGKGQQFGLDYYFQGIYDQNMRKNGILAWELKKPTKSVINQIQMCKNVTQVEKNRFSRSDVETSATQQTTHVKNYRFVYEGSFDVNHRFTERGKLKQPQGTYIGEFYQGLKHGKGEYFYVGQLRYVGDYENDYKSGYGILYNCDGTVAYEGEWLNGLPNGKGISYDLNGKKTEGIFVGGINYNMLWNQS